PRATPPDVPDVPPPPDVPDVLGLTVGGVVGPSTEPQPYSARSDDTASATVVLLK
ncbi:highly repetitive protein, partial [Burkholderia multivorans]